MLKSMVEMHYTCMQISIRTSYHHASILSNYTFIEIWDWELGAGIWDLSDRVKVGALAPT